MSRIVSLEDFTPGERFDGNPWTSARIEESASADGTFVALGTQALSPLDTDPRQPQSRNFTIAANLASGYYRVIFIDAGGHEEVVGPVFSGPVSDSYTSVLAVRRVLSPDGSTDATLGTAASLSENEIEQAIEEGAAEINARLAGRYTTPFAAPAPALVENLNRDIAAYLATLVYRRGDPIDPNDPVALRYARALSLLKDVQRGATELAISSGGIAESEPEVINPYEGDLFQPSDFKLGPTPFGTTSAIDGF